MQNILADNYRVLVGNKEFLDAIVHTLIIVATAVPSQTILALILAVLMNQPIKGKAVIKSDLPDTKHYLVYSCHFGVMILFRKDMIFAALFHI